MPIFTPKLVYIVNIVNYQNCDPGPILGPQEGSRINVEIYIENAYKSSLQELRVKIKATISQISMQAPSDSVDSKVLNS